MDTFFLQDYEERLQKQTLRYGLITSVIAIPAVAFFYWADTTTLGLTGTFSWRLVGFLAPFVFLLSYRIPGITPYIAILHAACLTAYLVMVMGIGHQIFSSSSSTTEQLFAVTMGITTVWVAIVILGAGSRKWLIPFCATILVVSASCYVVNRAEDGISVPYIVTVALIGLLAIIYLILQERYSRQRARDILELELNRQEIARQAHDLQIVNENLVTFTNAISHDLRGPLRRAESFLQLIERRSEVELTGESAEFFAMAKDNLAHALQVIQDLLTFSSLKKEELQKVRLDLKELCDQVLKEQTTELGEALQVQYELSQPIFGDRQLLWHLLSNLVNNAVKFTSGEPQPQIRIGTQKKGDQTLLYVSDNGVGFDEHYADQLGQPFKRLHGETFEGTGIGLSIVRQIMKLHQGSFWAKGRRGEGATFYCAFPDSSLKPTHHIE